MNRRLSHILAMTLVATALCADRATAAASTERTPLVTENRSLVGRLSSGLRRSVTPVRFVALRQIGRPIPSNCDAIRTPVIPPVRVTPITADQFPLPPPVL